MADGDRRYSGPMARPPAIRRYLLLALCLGLVAAAWWATRRAGPVVVESRPEGIMGTRCALAVVVSGGEPRRGERALRAAESELRRLEGLLSTWIDASEISGLNRAEAGGEVPLSGDSIAVLRRARQLWQATGGAFDITAGPLIEGWRRAAAEGRLPSPEELETLRGASRWEDLELSAGGAVKARSRLRVDVDGIAKGYAIDQALEAMRRVGAVGGMVEVGGDLRVFGESPGAGGWLVGVYDPFAERPAGEIEVADRAVCTSGGYSRFVEIDGRRYSHILDPRTGQPADVVVSATVLAGDAATADAWATALSVLGPEGLASRPPGVEALLLVAEDERPRGLATPGFPALDGPSLPAIERLD